MVLSVDEQNLAATKAFKLQYGYTATASCSTATYSDVTAASTIQFYDNTSATDGASLTTNANDPVKSGYTTVNQTYEEANSFTVATQVNTSQAGMWDFNLTTTTNVATNGSYCLRAVWANGMSLHEYGTYPMIYAQASDGDLQQGNSRLYENTDSTTPGTPLAKTNEGTSLASSNQAFRARVGGSLQLGLM